jgi:transcriptional regulator with XRE-family HTH domain
MVKAKTAAPGVAVYMTGEQFKASRERLGLTLAEMAAAMGYKGADLERNAAGVAAVIRWQRAGPPPPAEQLTRQLLATARKR